MSRSSGKLLAIGLDGAEIDYIRSRARSLPTLHAELPARRVNAPRIGAMNIEPDPVRGGDHTDHGFALLVDSYPQDLSAPPLTRTEEFAAFLTYMETRGNMAQPVVASL